MDFISPDIQLEVGVMFDEQDALVILDLHTRWVQVFAMKGRTAKQVAMCLLKFLGRARCLAAYCDGAPELKAALTELGIPDETSLPGKPQTNGLIEMQVGKVLRGTRALLTASGLPMTMWPMAASAYAFSINLQRSKIGRSPWNLRKLREFKGTLIPFGAYINYIPPTTTKLAKLMTQFAGNIVPGLFLGYQIGYGGSWRGGYVTCPLEAFVSLPKVATAREVGD